MNELDIKLYLMLKNYVRLFDNALENTINSLPENLIKKEKGPLGVESITVDYLKPIYTFKFFLEADIDQIEKFGINR